MTSIVSTKDTGIVCLFLSGLLLPSVLVTGQSSATEMNTTTPSTASTNMSSSTMPMATTNLTTMSAAAAASDSAATPPQSTMPTTYGDGRTAANDNATSNSSMTMVYCPSFSCNYSECTSMYYSQNASACDAGESCQLLRTMSMWYSVSCSASCVESCTNASQTNCSVNCCNSTGCLNSTFASMMMMTTTTTVAATTTRAPPTTTSTTANNGNKCHKGTCTGEACYKDFKSDMLEICSSMQPHCQLKKETSGSNTVWTAGCSNCTGYAACSDAAKAPCNLECCTATTTSCLMLNGSLNVPSFATRGPYLHTELIASLLCLLAITLLL